MPRTPNTMVKRCGKSEHPCLVPDFSGKAFKLFTLEYYTGCGLVINDFYYVETCPLCTHFGESVCHEWMLGLVRCFSSLLRCCVIFVFSSVDVLCHTDGCARVGPL